MTKFHINNKGEVRPCDVKVRDCGFGEVHYNTQEAAQRAYEQKMNPRTFSTTKKDRVDRSTTINETGSMDDIKIVENFNKESEKERALLSENPNATETQLVEAYRTAKSLSVYRALAAHDNFPIEQMSPHVFGAVITDEKTAVEKVNQMAESNTVWDEHFKSVWRRPVIEAKIKMLSNRDNQLSTELILEEGSKNPRSLRAACDSGRFPADKIKDQPAFNIRQKNIFETTNSEYLQGYAEWCAKNEYGYGATAKSSLQTVAENKNTNPETLDYVTRQATDESFLNKKILDIIYKHPNVKSSTKSSIDEIRRR